MEDVKIGVSAYNPEKSTEVAVVRKSLGTYGENPDDDWTETLYMKSNGEFFAIGEGGKNTPFFSYKNGKAENRVVTVWQKKNTENAKLWVYNNCRERMKEIFAPDEKSSIAATVLLTLKAKRNLKRKAEETHTSISELIRSWAEALY